MPHATIKTDHRSRAKQLRQTMTRAETLLWRYIKAHRVDGFGFRRQMPLGSYVVDFICLAAKLVVELDGESHDFVSRQIVDARRDAFLASQGFTVLRFTNEQVLTNLAGVVETIRETVSSCNSNPPPSLPLPHKGGGAGSSSQGRSMTTGLASYITIVVTLLTLVGGFFTYSFQRRADRKNQLIEIRRAAYRAYLSALMDQINAPTNEHMLHLLKCEFELFAVASDATIKKIGEFSNYMIATSYENKNKRDVVLHKQQLAEVLLAMRNDCFEKTRLSIKEASQLLPMQ